jgi:hypothetical protein
MPFALDRQYRSLPRFYRAQRLPQLLDGSDHATINAIDHVSGLEGRLTESSSPRGSPSASTISPCFNWFEIAERKIGQIVAIDLDHRQIGFAIHPDDGSIARTIQAVVAELARFRFRSQLLFGYEKRAPRPQ